MAKVLEYVYTIDSEWDLGIPELFFLSEQDAIDYMMDNLNFSSMGLIGIDEDQEIELKNLIDDGIIVIDRHKIYIK